MVFLIFSTIVRHIIISVITSVRQQCALFTTLLLEEKEDKGKEDDDEYEQQLLGGDYRRGDVFHVSTSMFRFSTFSGKRNGLVL